MMGTMQVRPFVPRHPPKSIDEDLDWWTHTLSLPSLSRDIPGGRHITDVLGFSNASSAVGIGIVIGDKWRAWRLLPNWKSGGRDIGWAEAVAMELLVRTVLISGTFQGIQIFGDNTSVMEGWWSGRSHNTETNRVFRRIHQLLDKHDTILKTKYVNTKDNPADGPSRGVFSPAHLLLPPVKISDNIRPFLISFNYPPHPSENATPQCVAPSPKTPLSSQERAQQRQANNSSDNSHIDQPQVRTSSSSHNGLYPEQPDGSLPSAQ